MNFGAYKSFIKDVKLYSGNEQKIMHTLLATEL